MSLQIHIPFDKYVDHKLGRCILNILCKINRLNKFSLVRFYESNDRMKEIIIANSVLLSLFMTSN